MPVENGLIAAYLFPFAQEKGTVWVLILKWFPPPQKKKKKKKKIGGIVLGNTNDYQLLRNSKQGDFISVSFPEMWGGGGFQVMGHKQR